MQRAEARNDCGCLRGAEAPLFHDTAGIRKAFKARGCCRTLFGPFASGPRTHYTRTFAVALIATSFLAADEAGAIWRFSTSGIFLL